MATRASGSGALTIYVDGASVASQISSIAWTPAANVIIGSGVGNRVSVDNSRLYDVALDPAGVLQLYNGAVPAYCAAVHRFGNSANVSQLNVSRPDTRGGFVPGIGELTLTVDADPPTVQLTAPATNNTYYKGSSGTPEILRSKAPPSIRTRLSARLRWTPAAVGKRLKVWTAGWLNSP